MDEYLGVIKLFAVDYVPEGYLPCDGRSLTIVQNQALYALLGLRFGGNGTSVFLLPKLTPPCPDTVYGICVQGMWPVRP